MKKLYKVLAAAFAFALVLASPNMTIMSHAQGFNADATEWCNGEEGVAPSVEESWAEYLNNPSDSGASNSGGQDSGNHNSGSSNNGNQDSGSSNNSSNHTETVYNEAGEAQTVVASDGGSSYVKPNYTPGSQTSAGKQNFREVVNAGAGTYKVIHCGSEKMTFTLKDVDGKAKAADSIALKTLADGRWAINFTVKDATGCTIGAPLDRTYMYDTLGVSCVTINDTVIIDIAAESAAK